jgi:type II secretory pathway pseudopilin PulG
VYTCRQCEQPINQATEVCPYCGADLTESSVDASEAKPRKKSAARIAILWGAILSSLAAIAWFAFPWRLAGSKSDAERHALAAIADLQKALSSYQASEGTFPSSLEPLGAAARDASQKAQSGRYTLEYTAGKPDADGRIRTYTLAARAGNYGYLNLFADETGTIRGTREDRAATAQDPPIETDSPGPLFLSLNRNISDESRGVSRFTITFQILKFVISIPDQNTGPP